MAVLFHADALPVTLRPSKKRLAFLTFVALAFVALGVTEIHSQEATLVGWACTLFFGLGVVVFVLNLLPGAAYLRLEREGFIFCSLFRRTHMRWGRIATFSVYRITTKSLVGWNYVPGLEQSSAAIRSVNRGLAGCDAGFPDTYGCKANDLADTLATIHAELGFAAGNPLQGDVAATS